ncbi:hypothetical protein GF326_05405 [Candidatus Bathyarchaeota archaeon]|nr:hypothetical protein [Candidatus Bathyarchaeota archaeon]
MHQIDESQDTGEIAEEANKIIEDTISRASVTNLLNFCVEEKIMQTETTTEEADTINHTTNQGSKQDR